MWILFFRPQAILKEPYIYGKVLHVLFQIQVITSQK